MYIVQTIPPMQTLVQAPSAPCIPCTTFRDLHKSVSNMPKASKLSKVTALRCSSTPKSTLDPAGIICGKCHFHGPVDARNELLSPNRLQIRNLRKKLVQIDPLVC